MLTQCRYMPTSKVFELLIVFVLHVFCVCAALRRGSVVFGEVAGICWAFHLRNDWTFHLAVIQRVPIDRFEEGMRFHRCSPMKIALRDIAQPLRRIDRAKCTDNILSVWRQAIRIFNLSFHDPGWKSAMAPDDVEEGIRISLFVYLDWLIVPEGWLPHQEFEQKDA